MNADISTLAPPPDLFVHLRETTALPHRRLERDLDLLRPPVERSRIVRLLRRWFGFHAVWESGLAEVQSLRTRATASSQLAALETDLRSLGADTEGLAQLERCTAARRLTRSPEAAMGSLYVMEGSRLGAEFIDRALGREAWYPATGLCYFRSEPPGARLRWAEFQTWSRKAWPPASFESIAVGALDTFTVLHGWLIEDDFE